MDNEQRIFEDLLSVDAWHFEFDEKNREVDLHALIVFDQAKLGGVGEVSFTLKLRRARLEICLPSDFKVSTETILQITPRTVSHTLTNATASTSGFSLSGCLRKLNPSLEVNAQAGATRERGEKTESFMETTMIEAKAGWAKNKVWWDFTSIDTLPLDGPAWESTESARLTIDDNRQDTQRLQDIRNCMTPPVELRVICNREDLVIDINTTLSKRLNGKNLAAAESYIRNALTRRGLEFEGNLSTKIPYAMIELASGFVRTRKNG